MLNLESNIMKMESVNVTPEMAQEWLASANVQNRRLSPISVSKYHDDMVAGTWRNTHQNAIAFYQDGTLADGQHRLAAIVSSGVTVQMFVATGLEKIDASAIDQGRPRSAMEALRFGGLLTSEKYLSGSVAIVKMIKMVEEKNGVMTISEMADKIEEVRAGIDFAMAHSNSVQRGLGTAMLRAALVVGWYKLPFAKIDQFARVLVSGIPDERSDVSVIRLRNWILQNKPYGQSGRNAQYMTILRVMHAYEMGEELGVIRKSEKLYYKTGLFSGK